MKRIKTKIPRNCMRFPNGFPDFFFTFKGQRFSLKPHDYVANNKKCSSDPQHTTARIVFHDHGFSDNMIALGVPYLKTVYTVFHIDKKSIGFANEMQLTDDDET